MNHKTIISILLLSAFFMSQNLALACNCAKKNNENKVQEETLNSPDPGIKKSMCEMQFDWILKSKLNNSGEYSIIGCADQDKCQKDSSER